MKRKHELKKTPKILKKMLNLRDDCLHPVDHLHPVYRKLLKIFINAYFFKNLRES
jgi:hypothetical protein